MKRFFAVVLTLVLSFSLASCSDGTAMLSDRRNKELVGRLVALDGTLAALELGMITDSSGLHPSQNGGTSGNGGFDQMPAETGDSAGMGGMILPEGETMPAPPDMQESRGPAEGTRPEEPDTARKVFVPDGESAIVSLANQH